MAVSGNSPVVLTGEPVLNYQRLDYTKSPNGSWLDEGIYILVQFHTMFDSGDRFRSVHQFYLMPMADFVGEQIVTKMLAAAQVPKSLILPDLIPMFELILYSGQSMAFHRPPGLTLLRLKVHVYLPVNRLPTGDQSDERIKTPPPTFLGDDGDEETDDDEPDYHDEPDYDDDPDYYDVPDDETMLMIYLARSANRGFPLRN